MNNPCLGVKITTEWNIWLHEPSKTVEGLTMCNPIAALSEMRPNPFESLFLSIIVSTMIFVLFLSIFRVGYIFSE